MNFGIGELPHLRNSPVRDTYSASFSRRFGLLSSPPPSPNRINFDMDETQHNDSSAIHQRESNVDRDHSAAIHYEDCTGAAFRIRKGISRTPLQVTV